MSEYNYNYARDGAAVFLVEVYRDNRKQVTRGTYQSEAR